jgi:hypothetical protein
MSALRLLQVPNAEGDTAIGRVEELARAVLGGAARGADVRELATMVLESIPPAPRKCSTAGCLYLLPPGKDGRCDVCRALEARR